MKIKVVSDLHLEFGTISIENNGADVLILSGDICVAKDLNDKDVYETMGHNKSSMYHTFFQECCARFPNVIYIAGNHEHYHGDYPKSIPRLKEKLGYLVNLHILDKESVMLNDVLFIGGTLWTDMNKEDPITLSHIRGIMNDYRIVDNTDEVVHYKDPIEYGKREDGSTDYGNVLRWEHRTRPAKFSPLDSVADHKAMLKAIDEALARVPVDQKVVIVGHHAPCKLSTKPRYEKEVIMNGAYSSDLSEYILDHPQIKLWTHGHTHSFFDYMIGTTRITCNPRGYHGYEENEEFQPDIIIEV